jgi:hypothetical protein
MVDLPEYSSDHLAGRSCVVMGEVDSNGYVPIVPFSTEEDWNHPGYSLYPKGVGGRNADGYLMIRQQGFAHISRIYSYKGHFSEMWIDRVYHDLESFPHRIIPQVYPELI